MSRLRAFAEALVSRLPAQLQPMAHWRFIKFGVVGASGTVINVAVLYVSQEFLLLGIEDFRTRLNFFNRNGHYPGYDQQFLLEPPPDLARPAT